MTIEHKFTLTWARGATSITKTITETWGSENNLDEAVTDGTTNGLVAWACDFSQLKAFYMVSDQAITVYTNDAGTGAPDNTFVLVANEPVLWWAGSLLTNPFTADVTALYVTNASGSTAAFKIRKLEDPTV
jgi:hypothetical protein